MPKRYWIPAAVFGVLMIGLLAAQVVLIEHQRELIKRQKVVGEAQRATVLGLLEGGRDALPALRKGARGANALLEDARPLARDLRPLTTDARTLVREMNLRDTPEAIESAGALAETLLRGDRFVSMIDRTDRVLSQLERNEFVPETLRIQRELLTIQRQTFAILQESLAVQKETRDSARSLDRKTGGTPPVAP